MVDVFTRTCRQADESFHLTPLHEVLSPHLSSISYLQIAPSRASPRHALPNQGEPNPAATNETATRQFPATGNREPATRNR